MSGWTITIRAALASLLGLFSLAASFCQLTDQPDSNSPEPVTATVSDQPARVLVTDEEDEALQVDEDEADTVETSSGPAAAHTSDAIAEVRRQQGDLLRGTILGQQTSPEHERQEFQAALKRVAREAEATVPALRAESPLAPSLIPAAPQTDGSALLRQAARELESRAADYENVREFEAADRLRRLSRQLWREARRWDDGAKFPGPMY